MNISAKYYENLTMLSRVRAKNVGDVFFETHCRCRLHYRRAVPTLHCCLCADINSILN